MDKYVVGSACVRACLVPPVPPAALTSCALPCRGEHRQERRDRPY